MPRRLSPHGIKSGYLRWGSNTLPMNHYVTDYQRGQYKNYLVYISTESSVQFHIYSPKHICKPVSILVPILRISYAIHGPLISPNLKILIVKYSPPTLELIYIMTQNLNLIPMHNSTIQHSIISKYTLTNTCTLRSVFLHKRFAGNMLSLKLDCRLLCRELNGFPYHHQALIALQTNINHNHRNLYKSQGRDNRKEHLVISYRTRI